MIDGIRTSINMFPRSSPAVAEPSDYVKMTPDLADFNRGNFCCGEWNVRENFTKLFLFGGNLAGVILESIALIQSTKIVSTDSILFQNG